MPVVLVEMIAAELDTVMKDASGSRGQQVLRAERSKSRAMGWCGAGTV